MIELEPLGEEAALIRTEDALRLDWVIETAEVTDTPFYLQIARELHQKGLLGRAHPERSRLDSARLDRATSVQPGHVDTRADREPEAGAARSQGAP